MAHEPMSPRVWARIIREAQAYLNMTNAQLGEVFDRSPKTIWTWQKEKRTPPAKRMEGYQQRLLRLGVPTEIVYGSRQIGAGDRDAEAVHQSAPRLAQPDRRRRPELRRVFRVVEKMIEKQNAKMTRELKAALARLLKVEANGLSRKH